MNINVLWFFYDMPRCCALGLGYWFVLSQRLITCCVDLAQWFIGCIMSSLASVGCIDWVGSVG